MNEFYDNNFNPPEPTDEEFKEKVKLEVKEANVRALEILRENNAGKDSCMTTARKEVYANARRATLPVAQIIYNMLKLHFEPEGYLVLMGGSVLAFGEGRDIDIVMIRQKENAMPPGHVAYRLVTTLGFEQLIEESGEDEYGWVGLRNHCAVDITIMGWGGPNELKGWAK
jgi:hypothetical protein